MTGCTLRRAVFLSSLVAVGCAGTKITPIAIPNRPPIDVQNIALAPSGGILADAVGVALLNYGVQVFDTQQTSNLLVRLNLDEIELMLPENLDLLHSDFGVEAVMFVRTTAGYDDKPQNASVRMVDTRSGKLLGGLAWQQARGGASQSAVDSFMRKDVVDVSIEIAEALALQFDW